MKYRSEEERETAWIASQMAQEALAQQLLSGGQPIAAPLVSRHPIIEKIFANIKEENWAASLRARERNKMKV